MNVEQLVLGYFERKRWEKNEELREKKKFRMDLKRAVRSDGEKETLRAVFRSSFNN